MMSSVWVISVSLFISTSLAMNKTLVSLLVECSQDLNVGLVLALCVGLGDSFTSYRIAMKIIDWLCRNNAFCKINQP